MNQPVVTDETLEVVRASVAVADDIRTLIAILRRRTWLALFLVLAVVVSSSGWWLTAHDHSAQQHSAKVSDCKSLAQAQRLDDFTQVIVGTPAQIRRATLNIRHGQSLLVSYINCIQKGHP